MLNRLRHTGLAALCALTLVSCSEENKTTGESAGAMNAFTDSLAYCMGQSQAYRYWQQASVDSTLRGQAGRDDYLAGYRAALKLMQSDNNAYNEGVLAGIQSAYGGVRLGNTFGITLDLRKMEEGMAAGMASDTAVNPLMLRGMMDALKVKLEKTKTLADRKSADKELAALTKKGFKKLEPGFYYREIKPGSGPLLKDKEIVRATLSLRRLDGQEIVSPSEPGEVSVGSLSYTESVNRALTMMRAGAEYEFATPASSFFGLENPTGHNTKINSDTPVIWTLKLGEIIPQ